MSTSKARQWTIFTNHAAVLLYLLRHPQATIRAIADDLGLAERTVVNVLADLRTDGHLLVQKTGRQNVYLVNPDAEMRRPEHTGHHIREFLNDVVHELEHARALLDNYDLETQASPTNAAGRE